MSWRLRFRRNRSAPTHLLSVSVRRTEHQRLHSVKPGSASPFSPTVQRGGPGPSVSPAPASRNWRPTTCAARARGCATSQAANSSRSNFCWACLRSNDGAVSRVQAEAPMRRERPARNRTGHRRVSGCLEGADGRARPPLATTRDGSQIWRRQAASTESRGLAADQARDMSLTPRASAGPLACRRQLQTDQQTLVQVPDSALDVPPTHHSAFRCRDALCKSRQIGGQHWSGWGNHL